MSRLIDGFCRMLDRLFPYIPFTKETLSEHVAELEVSVREWRRALDAAEAEVARLEASQSWFWPFRLWRWYKLDQARQRMYGLHEDWSLERDILRSRREQLAEDFGA